MKVEFFFRWYDLWVGFYWDRNNRELYFCPVPCCGLKLDFGPQYDSDSERATCAIIALSSDVGECHAKELSEYFEALRENRALRAGA